MIIHIEHHIESTSKILSALEGILHLPAECQYVALRVLF